MDRVALSIDRFPYELILHHSGVVHSIILPLVDIPDCDGGAIPVYERKSSL